MQLELMFTISALNRHWGSHTSSHKIKNILTFISYFIRWIQISSLVMGSKMDYWQSFRIKISHMICTPEIIIFGDIGQI